ncbi:MAG: hypothetical protein D6788_05235, partial [Planctomycetota bacterium]
MPRKLQRMIPVAAVPAVCLGVALLMQYRYAKTAVTAGIRQDILTRLESRGEALATRIQSRPPETPSVDLPTEGSSSPATQDVRPRRQAADRNVTRAEARSSGRDHRDRRPLLATDASALGTVTLVDKRWRARDVGLD